MRVTCTLPKTNIAPENQWLELESSFMHQGKYLSRVEIVEDVTNTHLNKRVTSKLQVATSFGKKKQSDTRSAGNEASCCFKCTASERWSSLPGWAGAIALVVRLHGGLSVDVPCHDKCLVTPVQQSTTRISPNPPSANPTVPMQRIYLALCYWHCAHGILVHACALSLQRMHWWPPCVRGAPRWRHHSVPWCPCQCIHTSLA